MPRLGRGDAAEPPGDGADDLGASDELIAFKDEGEQEEDKRGAAGGRDLDDVKSSLVNESETNNSGSEAEADHRSRAGSELEGRMGHNQVLHQALRKQQHGGLLQPSPYLSYPFFMIPDIANLCGPYGALAAGGRTYLPFQWPLLDLPGTSALRDTTATHLSNNVPVVQHPHVTHLHPLLSYSPEAFSPQRASPGFSPDAGVSRSPHAACYPVSPGGVAQIAHPLSWLQGQSIYPLPGGLSPAALAMNASVSSLMAGGYSSRLVTPPRSSLPSTATGGSVVVKQEPGECSGQPAGKMMVNMQQKQREAEEEEEEEEEEKRKPHIKKPLNAFMLYMREERGRVVSECNVKESATINQILGQRWHSLTKEEQAKYYELARKERLIHSKLYPGWSARDNYGKKKKRKRMRSQTELDVSTSAMAPAHDFPVQLKRPRLPVDYTPHTAPARPPITQPPVVSHLTHTHLSQASPASSLDSPATPTTSLASPAAPASTHTEHTHSSPFGPMSPYGEQLQPLSLTTKPHRTAPPLRPPPSSSPHAASSRTPPPPPPPFLVPPPTSIHQSAASSHSALPLPLSLRRANRQ